jgi:hypothetical protein
MKQENNAGNLRRERNFVALFEKSVSPNNGLQPQTNLKRG